MIYAIPDYEDGIVHVFKRFSCYIPFFCFSKEEALDDFEELIEDVRFQEKVKKYHGQLKQSVDGSFENGSFIFEPVQFDMVSIIYLRERLKTYQFLTRNPILMRAMLSIPDFDTCLLRYFGVNSDSVQINASKVNEFISNNTNGNLKLQAYLLQSPEFHVFYRIDLRNLKPNGLGNNSGDFAKVLVYSFNQRNLDNVTNSSSVGNNSSAPNKEAVRSNNGDFNSKDGIEFAIFRKRKHLEYLKKQRQLEDSRDLGEKDNPIYERIELHEQATKSLIRALEYRLRNTK